MASKAEHTPRGAWREITPAEAGVAEVGTLLPPQPVPDPVSRLLGAPPDARARLRGFELVIVGAGGIGAALVDLLPAFMLRTVRIVDRDTFGPGNLRGQPITPADLGKPKCVVVGRRLKARSPETRVFVHHGPFESLTAADLCAAHALALTGDNLALTHAASARGCAMGMFLVEGAVHGPTAVSQVRRCAPGNARSCPVCTWDASEERALAAQTRFACDGSGRALENPAGPTGALPAVCVQAASWMAMELLRWFLGFEDRDVTVETCALSRATVVSPLLPNPRCRVDHSTWRKVRGDRPLAELGPSEVFALAGVSGPDGRARHSLEIEGARWVSRGSCACPAHPSVDRFVGRSVEAETLGDCARCASPLRAHPFHTHVAAPGELFSACADRPLAVLGAADARGAIVRGSRGTVLVLGPARVAPARRAPAPVRPRRAKEHR